MSHELVWKTSESESVQKKKKNGNKTCFAWRAWLSICLNKNWAKKGLHH